MGSTELILGILIYVTPRVLLYNLHYNNINLMFQMFHVTQSSFFLSTFHDSSSFPLGNVT